MEVTKGTEAIQITNLYYVEKHSEGGLLTQSEFEEVHFLYSPKDTIWTALEDGPAECIMWGSEDHDSILNPAWLKIKE